MDKGGRRDDRRRREDTRDHKPRYDRDRSRSPPPRDRRDDRRRDRSPPRGPGRGPPPRSDRDRDHNRGRDRAASGTPPPPRKPGDRAPPRQPLDTRPNNAAPKGAPKGRGQQDREAARDVKMQNGVEDEDSEAEMERLLGFKSFRSTKNTKVPGNDKNYGVYKAKKTEYRQYMNRTGGFNRPLSPSRV